MPVFDSCCIFILYLFWLLISSFILSQVFSLFDSDSFLIPVRHACSQEISVPSQKPGWALNQTQAHVHPNIDSERPVLALGLEGSANKLGAGVVKHAPDSSSIVLSNVRHTYITPPGEGFQPRDTALHHREWAFKVIKESLSSANVSMSDLDCICYTKGERILSEIAGANL